MSQEGCKIAQKFPRPLKEPGQKLGSPRDPGAEFMGLEEDKDLANIDSWECGLSSQLLNPWGTTMMLKEDESPSYCSTLKRR